jgi:hypothetical protein
MSTNSGDLYAVLGVPQDAPREEIAKKYKEAIKKNHPDKYNGLLAKYRASGDSDLLRLLEIKIEEAEEFTKLLNEAYDILSDPIKRAEYDKICSSSPDASGSTPPKPEIIIDCTGLDFGVLREGDIKVGSFTVENNGGPVGNINLDWEKKPSWGEELSIKAGPYGGFPIEVRAVVKATKVAEGYHRAKILINADGEIRVVRVVFNCIIEKATVDPTHIPKAPYTTPISTPPSPATKVTSGFPVWLIPVLIVGFLLLCGVGSLLLTGGTAFTSQKVSATQTKSARIDTTQTAKFATMAVETNRENEAKLALSNPTNVLVFQRISGGILGENLPGPGDFDRWVQGMVDSSTYGQYKITNISKYLELYFSLSRKTQCWVDGSGSGMGSLRLKPGASVTVYCVEAGPILDRFHVGENCWDFYIEHFGKYSCIQIPRQ